jgi:poly(3-hydroxybutyrate) depolymerase
MPPDSPHHATPAVARRVLASGVESWRVALGGTADYWRGALARGATPLDLVHDVSAWWRAASVRREPTWASPNRVVMASDLVRLRDFAPDCADPVVPTLLFPPQAGHSSCIVDFSPDQSQVATARAAGLTRLYSLDWVGATAATRNATVEDHLRFVERAVEHIGGPVNLVGDCQGGWLATIYAALHPEHVHTLTVAGAPIDFHAGEGAIHDFVRFLSPADVRFYERMVRLGGGVLKGELMLGGFISLKPESEVEKHVQLMNHIRDEEHLARHRAFEDWFKHTQDIPGPFYLWIVERLFRDNALIRGDLQIDGRPVDLRAIRAPLHLLAGANDHITPPAQVFALGEAASTPPAEVARRTTTGGHLGLFMGREALRDHWSPIFADVYARSRKAGRPAKRVSDAVARPYSRKAGRPAKRASDAVGRPYSRAGAAPVQARRRARAATRAGGAPIPAP